MSEFVVAFDLLGSTNGASSPIASVPTNGTSAFKKLPALGCSLRLTPACVDVKLLPHDRDPCLLHLCPQAHVQELESTLPTFGSSFILNEIDAISSPPSPLHAAPPVETAQPSAVTCSININSVELIDDPDLLQAAQKELLPMMSSSPAQKSPVDSFELTGSQRSPRF